MVIEIFIPGDEGDESLYQKIGIGILVFPLTLDWTKFRECRTESLLKSADELELSKVMDDCKETGVFEYRGRFLGNAHTLTRCCAESGRIRHGLAWGVVFALLILPGTKPFLFLFPILYFYPSLTF